MLKYIGTQTLLVNKDFTISEGDVVGDENLCAKLEHRSDFIKIKSGTNEPGQQDENVPNIPVRGRKVK